MKQNWTRRAEQKRRSTEGAAVATPPTGKCRLGAGPKLLRANQLWPAFSHTSATLSATPQPYDSPMLALCLLQPVINMLLLHA
jgi:hypothetical protein